MNRRELAAAYLLDDLDDAGRATVERRLVEDAELRSELEAMRPLLARLSALPGEAWPDDPIPEPEPEPAAPPAPRRWSVRPAFALAALLVVAALGVALGSVVGGSSDSEQRAPALLLRPLQPTAGEQATVAMPRAEEMVFRAKGLAPLGPDQYYELWLMSDAERTVPVASFRAGADGTALIRVPLPANPGRLPLLRRQPPGRRCRHRPLGGLGPPRTDLLAGRWPSGSPRLRRAGGR